MTSTSTGSANSKRLLLAGVACALALCLGAGEALAKKSVVILGFSGPRASRIRGDVVKALRRDVKLIPSGRYNRAQRKLRARRQTPANVRKVAAAIGADGVLSGRVKRTRGRYRLELTLRAGANGRVADTVTITLGRAPRLTRRAERNLSDDLLALIDDLPDVGRGGRSRGRDRRDRDRDEDVIEEEIIDTEGEEIDDDDEIVRDDVASRDGEEPLGGDDDRRDDRERDDPDPESEQAQWNRLTRNRGIDLSAGLSFMARSFSFEVADGIDATQAPNGYDGTLVPGAFVDVEVYPLLVTSKKANPGFIDQLGARVVVDYVLSISSTLESDMMGVEIPTSQLRWGVGAVYRYNFGDGANGPGIKLAAGYNKLTFELDKDAAADAGVTDISLPNVDYTYIDAGGDLRYPLTREGTLFAGGRLMVIQEAGEITDLYGAADVSGFSGEAGYEHRLSARLLVRGGARYQSVSFTFTSEGTESDRDGDGMSDVPAADDSYFGIYATAGYLF